MKIVVLVLLILIFILINKKCSFSSSSVYNGDYWSNYRLGDVVLMSKFSRFYDPSYSENIFYHTTEYPESIAAEYIEKNKKYQDFELLNKIINDRKIDYTETIDDRTLVLHIRVGDVLCKKVWIDNAKDHYSKVGNKNWWENVVNYIKKNGITRVVVIAGTHFKECLKESEEYILDRGNYLTQSSGVNVEYRLGQSPDEDLMFTQKAKHFITTGGGYGELLKIIANKNKSGN
jgi:hypothetical protein